MSRPQTVSLTLTCPCTTVSVFFGFGSVAAKVAATVASECIDSKPAQLSKDTSNLVVIAKQPDHAPELVARCNVVSSFGIM